MDRDAIEYTRQHYDAHANTLTPAEALRSRAEGAALPLKQYHNSIKRELINAFSGGPGASLLDLACGRGGDIWKWMDAGLSYVLGVDLSPGEVAEAARRFAAAKEKRAKGNKGNSKLSSSGLVAEFRECSTLGLEPFSAEPPGDETAAGGEEIEEANDEEDEAAAAAKRKRASLEDTEQKKQEKKKNKRRRRRRRFDSVSCMFAAHYFCSSDAALSTFLANVARNLRPGGFFFGTVPSGKKVMAAIKEGGQWPLLSTPMLRLEAQWKGAPLPFGCGYTCAIGNTVTSTATAEIEDDKATEQGSFEYLVFASAFSAIAARHGLLPFARWSSSPPCRNPGAATAAERLLDPADEQAHFKSFAPHFPGSDPSLERASELFQAFAFVKGADKGGEDEMPPPNSFLRGLAASLAAPALIVLIALASSRSSETPPNALTLCSLAAPIALSSSVAFFAVAAFVFLAEHPARLALSDDAAALAQWKPSYRNAAAIQAPLAGVAALLGALCWWKAAAASALETKDPLWLLGACASAFNLPYTVLVILPTNRALLAAPRGNAETRKLLVRWGHLHFLRVVAGGVSAAAFVVAVAKSRNSNSTSLSSWGPVASLRQLLRLSKSDYGV